MANKLILDGTDQTIPLAFSADVVGTAAAETIVVQGDQNVTFTTGASDRVEVAGNLADYTVTGSGNALTLTSASGNTITMFIGATSKLAFADGSVDMSVDLTATPPGPAMGTTAVAADGSFDTAAVQTELDATDGSGATGGTGGTGGTGEGQVFTLTKGIDDGAEFVGGTGDDTFNAKFAENVSTGLFTEETLNPLDVLDGGEGNNDTLTYYTDTTTPLPAASISNIETINVISGDTVTADTSVSTITGVKTLNAQATTGTVDIDTKSDVTSVSVTGSATTVAIDDAGTAATTADALATVSVTGATGNIAIGGGVGVGTVDSLTELNLTDTTNGDAIVSSAAGTRALTVNLNNVTGPANNVIITDDQATSLTVATTVKASSDIDLQADLATSVTIDADEKLTVAAIDASAAKTITVKGDSLVTFTTNTATDLGALTSIDAATSTGGVTFSTQLATGVAFAGGEGKDSVSVAATSQAITTGAGDDTVAMTGAVATGGSVDAGDGSDTLAMTAANAEAVSAGTTFEAGISNFEKVGLTTQVALGQTETINLSNLDDIAHLSSAGTAAGTGQAEVATVTFEALTSGQSVTVEGRVITATGGDASATDIASAFATGGNVGNAAVSGALSGDYTAGAAAGTVVALTGTAVGNDASDVSALIGLATQDDAVVAKTTPGVTAVAGANEVFTATFSNAAVDADTITFDGVTVAMVGGEDANGIAAKFAADYNTDAGGDQVIGYAAVNNGNGTVTFTADSAADLTDTETADFVVVDVAGAGMPVVSVAAPTTQGVTAVPGVAEVNTVTFGALLSGQSVTVAGRTVTANGADLTDIQVADAFENGVTDGAAEVSGTLSAAYTTSIANGDNTTVLTAVAPAAVATLTATNSNSPASTTPGVVVVDGDTTSGGGALVVNNLAANGTVELTAANAGTTTVFLKDSAGSSDTVNLKLNGTANLAAGAVNVASVENIAIEATDSSSDTTTVTNPTAVSTLALNAADATTITVTGNHGVDFSGSTLTKVTTLDASGVTADVNTTGMTDAQVVAANGVAGAVTLTTAVTGEDVTITTGNGNDVINAGSVGTAAGKTNAATITTGAGTDTVTGGADADTINTGSEADTVVATAGADTITLGAGNDIYDINLASNSVLATRDVLVGFSANTYGQGTDGKATKAGATTTVADRTGDVIDIAGIVGGLDIDVDVFTNAADAQTFIQNTADAGADTGIALDSTTGLLYIDTDSNGTIDSVIELTGITTIDEAAFVL